MKQVVWSVEFVKGELPLHLVCGQKKEGASLSTRSSHAGMACELDGLSLFGLQGGVDSFGESEEELLGDAIAEDGLPLDGDGLETAIRENELAVFASQQEVTGEGFLDSVAGKGSGKGILAGLCDTLPDTQNITDIPLRL